MKNQKNNGTEEIGLVTPTQLLSVSSKQESITTWCVEYILENIRIYLHFQQSFSHQIDARNIFFYHKEAMSCLTYFGCSWRNGGGPGVRASK